MCELFGLRSGSSLSDAESYLGSIANEEVVAGRTVMVVRASGGGIIAFCEDNVVYSLKLAAPLAGTIRGTRIGNSHQQVISALGKPHRVWPIQDGTDRWFYDREEFFRVDFMPERDAVEFIYL